jgi:hypothetical protein
VAATIRAWEIASHFWNFRPPGKNLHTRCNVISSAPENNYFCLTKGWCKFLLSKTHGSWLHPSLDVWATKFWSEWFMKFYSELFPEQEFYVVFSIPWLDRDPKWKGHVSQFLLTIFDNLVIWVCVCAHPACVMKFWIMFSQTKSLHRKKQTGEPKTDQFSTSRFRLTWRANQTRVT